MPRFQVTCSGCGQSVKIAPKMFGKLVECDSCGMQMQIPLPAVTLEEIPESPSTAGSVPLAVFRWQGTAIDPRLHCVPIIWSGIFRLACCC